MIKVFMLLLLAGGLWWCLQSLERRSLYFPDRTMIAGPAAYRLPYEDLAVRTSDGLTIHGWYIPAFAGAPAKGQRGMPESVFTVLFCHGNAGNISHRLDKMKRLRQTGVSLLLFDYRGYGRSEGHPSETGTYQDAEAAYRYLAEIKRLRPEQIVFFGESLGCAVALEMALRHPGAGLILESPFTSTAAMARRIFPWLPAQWIIRYRYDNISKISRLRMPLLVMHSPEDEIVPVEMGRQLFSAALEPKDFFELKGGHNEGYADTAEGYVDAVRHFLKAIQITPPTGEAHR